ncbi:MAG: cytochrome d ubiquinol oxidase subunit II [Bacteroidota bacterium]|nr:cytochrome d ubiquinol oxidase subunit II [Bacteroidota bacterium]
MEILWFIIVAFMLTMYVVLDGFDLGAGIIHLLVAKSDDERRLVLNSIGPLWDGNEVWILAAGGTLYFAFPLLYASSFSGFYLPLIIVLWLLMLRGLGIEFRQHIHNTMWKTFWDVVFSVASILLAIFFGAALGNVVRGVPLNREGYFFEPLWTTFTIVPESGILDWFTTLMGLVALFTLTTHGANYVAMKTEGEVQSRARSIASKASWGVVLTWVISLLAVTAIHPELWNNFSSYAWGYVFPVIGILGIVGMFYYNPRKEDGKAFLSSTLFIAGMLATTAFGLFPTVLPASTDPNFSLTVYNVSAKSYGLSVGLVWWILGIILASGYFIFIYRTFRGKVTLTAEGGGY